MYMMWIMLLDFGYHFGTSISSNGAINVHVVRIYPHYRGKNGSLVPIGHKGRFLPLENSKKQNVKW